MLKKFLLGVAAVVFASVTAIGANLSIMSGPQDPSQLLATINTLIQSINTGVSGRLSANLTATGTGITTAETNLFSYSLPASQLAASGDAVRVVCWGTSAANSNAKTATLYFGASSVSTSGAVVGSALFNNVKWRLEMIVMRSGAATQVVTGNGQVSTSPVAIYTNSGTDSLAAAVTIRCTGTTATALQDITAQGMLVEQIK